MTQTCDMLVERNRLGRTGIDVWPLALEMPSRAVEGTIDAATVASAIQRARTCGINMFDLGHPRSSLASALEPIDSLWREALRHDRRDLLLTANAGFGRRPTNVQTDACVSALRESVEETLRSVNAETIDVLFFDGHDVRVSPAETGEALTSLVRDGKVRFIGAITEAAAPVSELAQHCRIDVIRTRHNFWRRNAESHLFPFVRKHQLGCAVYDPFAGGLFGGMPSRVIDFGAGRFDPSVAGDWFRRTMKVAVRIKRLAHESGLSLSQFALAWILSQPEVDTIFTSVVDAKALEEFVAAAQITFDDATLRSIDETLVDDDVCEKTSKIS